MIFPMTDQYNRTIDYIRISVTDRCNLRCTYCMPEEGGDFLGFGELLTDEELLRLCRIFVSLGITKIKLTGGEPLIRSSFPALAQSICGLSGIESVTLTTNGVLLGEQLPALRKAGIRAVTVSLDAADAGTFQKITRQNSFDRVAEGIRDALRYPDIRLKINCVPLSGINEKQWVQLAALAREHPVDVRFIEMMPIGLGACHRGASQELVLSRLQDAFGPAVPVRETLGNGPASYIKFAGFIGNIGFISAVSHRFCASCNRVRLTADGFLKLCLQYTDGLSLKSLLRGGASDEEIRLRIEETIHRKPKGHQFDRSAQTSKDAHKEPCAEHLETRRMSEIGG